MPQVVQQMISRLIGGLEERITIVGWPDDRARCLEILYVLAQCRDAAQVRIDELITDARYSGASWTEIGHAVGLTRQAAHSHYRRHNHNQ